MSGTKENNEISNEERIKKLEVKADKVEDLLTLNICFTLIGCLFFGFLHWWQIYWPVSEIELGMYNFIFIGFLVFYGILNLIILLKTKKEAPKEPLWFEKEEINQNEPSL